MANKSIFNKGRNLPKADVKNYAGGKAYKLENETALAQICATGCLNSTYSVSAKDQLSDILRLAATCSSEYLAKLALYCHKNGHMKDSPVILCAILSTREDGRELLREIFPQIIYNGKMIRNFVQIMRSGVIDNRKSLGSCAKKLVQMWFQKNDADYIFRNSIGNNPSMSDVIKLAHPRPKNNETNALFQYLMNKEYKQKQLPALVKEFERFKKSGENAPDVPFQMIAPLDLSEEAWKELASNCSWQTLRMNLNTFARHNVYDNKRLLARLVDKLRSPDEVRNAKVFPYQLMTAYKHTENKIPNELRNALQDAMEIAVENVPTIDGQLYVCVDVSGSMQWSITGERSSVTTEVKCVDVAALLAASILRHNPGAVVIPFDDQAREIDLNPRDSIMTNAKKLSIKGGGTDCSSAMMHINRKYKTGDAVIFISDNCSWADMSCGAHSGLAHHFNEFKKNNKQAKLVCLDIVPNVSSPVVDSRSQLNIGGFSDSVFNVIREFLSGDMGRDNWVSMIKNFKVDRKAY